MGNFTQDERFFSIETPLEKDELLLTRLVGSEFISRLFGFELSVLSTNLAIKPEDLVGKQVTVKLHNEQGRTFHGYVNMFSFGESKSSDFREYRLSVVPWLWFLTKTENRRIFQNKTCKDIVSQIFADLGFNDYEFRAEGGKTREYCVQYGESDFVFVSRLLEEEGFAYFFRHEANKHTLIIVDKENAYEMCPEADVGYSKGSSPNTQITTWEHNYEFRKGVWTINDYNFKEPARNLISETTTQSKFAHSKKFKHYEYPDLYDFASGPELVKIRMDAEEVPMNTISGSGNCSTFYAGGVFKLTEHEARDEKGSYILTAVHHRASDDSYFSGQTGDSSYENDFVCIPADVHFRPLQVHKRPVMHGPQSAVVTGPAGEEIYIDEYGRIKVQFIWDREGKKDENSSCFLRVMQSWAGNGWGASFIPRIGHEVIVTFLDGDPDRPIVTGTVYNGANKPPYPSKTQSGIRTHSTKGGSASNYNEIRFEDKKDAEQLYIHAEKNMDTMVENDETLTVDNDRTKSIKHDENSTIGNDRNKTVNNNQTENIKNNKSITVGKNHDESVGSNMTISVEKDLKESVNGNYMEHVTRDYSLHAKTITMDADDKIVIQTGAAKIVMKSNGDITMSGKTINIKGSGNVVIKGSKVLTN